MPRGGGGSSKPTTRIPNQAEIDIYTQTGVAPLPDIVTWDFKPVVLEQLLEVVARGNQVLLRCGTGGRSLGIAIWTGDNRRPPTFFHDSSEVDEYCEKLKKTHESHPIGG